MLVLLHLRFHPSIPVGPPPTVGCGCPHLAPNRPRLYRCQPSPLSRLVRRPLRPFSSSLREVPFSQTVASENSTVAGNSPKRLKTGTFRIEAPDCAPSFTCVRVCECFAGSVIPTNCPANALILAFFEQNYFAQPNFNRFATNLRIQTIKIRTKSK